MSCAFAACAATAIWSGAQAGDLIYRPTNPGFGGNPTYFDYLITQAQLQNRHADDGGGGGGGGGGAAPEISFPPISIDLGGNQSPAEAPTNVEMQGGMIPPLAN